MVSQDRRPGPHYGCEERVCSSRASKIRARASAPKEDGVVAIDLSTGRRSACRSSLICDKYRSHHAQMNKCSRTAKRSRRLSERSIDWDIKDTIASHGCCKRNSQSLNDCLIFE